MENQNIESLFGTWILESCKIQRSDGEVEFPFGKNPKGFLIYDTTGVVSVNMMRDRRRAFSTRDVLLGSVEEKVAAYSSYCAYAGTFRVVGDCIHHDVQVSLFPNWIGTTLVRKVALQNNHLILETVPSKPDENAATLVWRRQQ